MAQYLPGEKAIMKLKTFLTYAAVTPLIFGLIYILLPATAAKLFGMPEVNDSVLFFFRTAGALMLSYAVLNWRVRPHIETHYTALKGVLWGNLVAHIFQGAFDGYASISGTINPWGYSGAAVHVAMIIGLVYFLNKYNEGVINNSRSA
jgi:hypothetical protein